MDSHTETSYRSFGDNLIDSIKGVAIGVVLFVVSFPLLWWNEGRLDLSTLAKRATIVAPTDGGTTGQGRLVSVTGALQGDAPLGDPDFLKPGAYVRLRREVEMYAWIEKVTSRETKQLGGGTKVEKTWSYERRWTASPPDSSEFKVPEGHENPPLGEHGASWDAARATIGNFSVDPASIELPPARPVTLTASIVVAGAPPRVGNYLYRGAGTLEAPTVGDVRIGFRAVESGRTVTAFAQRDGRTLVPYLHEGKDRLFRAVDGTHAEAVATLHGEHQTLTWILRLAGFLFMWLGLALVLGPINAVLDVIPLLGSAGRFLTGVALFPIALGLSGVTIVVAMLAHHPLLLLAVVVGTVAGGVFLVQRGVRARKAAGAR